MPVCIAGAHRSGTSMVAHLLQLCGLYLGAESNLVGPAFDNPEGFWENVHFVEINEQILSQLGGGWDVVPNLPLDWDLQPQMVALRIQATNVISPFMAHEPWGWKDPRNSLTLSFWQHLLPNLKGVICLRSPLDIAYSLQKRGFSSLTFGFNLWRAYYQNILANTTPHNRIVTHYDSYFQDAKAELQRLLHFLDISCPPEMLDKAVAAASSKLRHHQTSLADLLQAQPSQDVIQLYMNLCAQAGTVYQLALQSTPILYPLPEHVTPQTAAYLNQLTQARLTYLETQVSQKEQTIQRLSDELVQRYREVSHLIGQVEERQHTVDASLEQLNTAQQQLNQSRQQIDELNTQISALKREVEEQQRAGDASLEQLNTQISALERENAERDQYTHLLNEHMGYLQHETEALHRSKLWQLGSLYWRMIGMRRSFSDAPRQVLWQVRSKVGVPVWRRIPRRWRPGLKRLLRLGPTLTDIQERALTECAAEMPAVHRVVTNGTGEQERTIFATRDRSKTDVIVLSVFEWHFLFQRPQHLAAQYAEHGHRVFWVSSTLFHERSEPMPFSTRGLHPNICGVQLRAHRPLNIYGGTLEAADVEMLRAGLEALITQYDIHDAVIWVQIPTWTPLALALRQEFGWKLVFDCMDEWAGFPNIGYFLLAQQETLVRAADLVVVSAERLWQKWHEVARTCVLARNAASDVFFTRYSPNNLLTSYAHPIIGYFGAIAEWADLDLIFDAARNHPEWTFVLIGGTTDTDLSVLRALRNVHFLGIQPYELIPKYLYHFDVCLIPFKISNLTESTSPVKFYEYLTAGKPVVATPLPELQPYANLCYLASTSNEFTAQIECALREHDYDVVQRRLALAQANTWSQRFASIDAALSATYPAVSLLIVTYNNLDLTQRCIESITRNTSYPNLELILVDNASNDETPAYLRALQAQSHNVQIILNETNTGFAHANNQALQAAHGEVLVFLNNDTLVTPGWLTRLLYHLAYAEIGLIGPVTNFSGNEACIPTTYQTLGDMEAFAKQYTQTNWGKLFDIPVAALFCAAMRRDTFEKVGLLDEEFGIGMFEDDDYAHRMRQLGYRVVCAEDVFIHHFGRAAFKKLDASVYEKLFETNRQHFERKWQITWVRHQGREANPVHLTAHASLS